jgi:hypothetical protein
MCFPTFLFFSFQIDGVQIYLPYTSSGIKIHYSGLGVIVISDRCNIRLFWNGQGFVTLSVPFNFGASLTGICGNCNTKRDDLKTSSGKDVSRYGKKIGSYIGESYIVTEANKNQT